MSALCSIVQQIPATATTPAPCANIEYEAGDRNRYQRRSELPAVTTMESDPTDENLTATILLLSASIAGLEQLKTKADDKRVIEAQIKMVTFLRDSYKELLQKPFDERKALLIEINKKYNAKAVADDNSSSGKIQVSALVLLLCTLFSVIH